MSLSQDITDVMDTLRDNGMTSHLSCHPEGYKFVIIEYPHAEPIDGIGTTPQEAIAKAMDKMWILSIAENAAHDPSFCTCARCNEGRR